MKQVIWGLVLAILGSTTTAAAEENCQQFVGTWLVSCVSSSGYESPVREETLSSDICKGGERSQAQLARDYKGRIIGETKTHLKWMPNLEGSVISYSLRGHFRPDDPRDKEYRWTDEGSLSVIDSHLVRSATVTEANPGETRVETYTRCTGRRF